MNKRYKRYILPRLCILLLGMGLGLLAKAQPVKADLILEGRQIDGACAIFYDEQPLKEIQYNGVVVWRAGADITYCIDSDTSEKHFVPYGQTTIAVTGSKEGYEFVGWRTDTAASGDILETDLCTGDEKTLYAVFRRPVTLTTYNNSQSPSVISHYLYYNNGNTLAPSFAVEQASKPGWTARGWSTGTVADADVTYNTISGQQFTQNTTLYGLYQKTVTLTTVVTGSSTSRPGTAYYNSSGNTVNPIFTVANPALSGAAFNGWSNSSASTALSYSSINDLSISESLILYSIFKYEDSVITTAHNSYSVPARFDNGNTVGTFASGIDCSTYSGITVSYSAWSKANGGSAEQELYLEVGGTKRMIANSWCDPSGEPHDSRTNGTVTIMFTKTSGFTDLIGYAVAYVYDFEHDGYIKIIDSTLTLIGKTVVG